MEAVLYDNISQSISVLVLAGPIPAANHAKTVKGRDAALPTHSRVSRPAPVGGCYFGVRRLLRYISKLTKKACMAHAPLGASRAVYHLHPGSRR